MQRNYTMKKIRIAQIGITHEHAQGKLNSLLKASELFDVAGVVDDSANVHTPIFVNPKDFNYYGLPRLTLEELLSDPTIEAVTIEAPNNECVPIALKCAERGLAMHMDKPGGNDSALFKQLMDICDKKQIPFQMGYMFRGNPAIQFVLNAAKKGWFGNIVGVQGSMIHNYGGPEYQRYLAGFPGGIVYNLSCHFIDFFMKLLGSPDSVTSFIQDGPDAAPGSQNLALTVLHYPHAFATVRAFDTEPGGGNRRVRIDADKALVEWMPVERFDGNQIEVLMILKEGNECYEAGTHIVKFGPVNDRYGEQFREFAEVIRGKAQDSYSRSHDYAVHRAVLAASGISPWHK